MPVLVRAYVDRVSGWVRLTFGYDQKTIQTIKLLPGSRWDKGEKSWFVPLHSWALLARVLPHVVVSEYIGGAPLPPEMERRLRPYQVEAATHLVRNGGFLLTMEQRTGKTPVAITSACAMLGSGQAEAVLVTYPSQVKEVWQEQFLDWARIDMDVLESFEPFKQAQLERLREKSFLVLGCHYEILAQREDDLHQLLRGKRFVLISDEIQRCKNRKIRQTKALHRLANAKEETEVTNARWGEEDPEAYSIKTGTCVRRWGLTGTPQRNYPRDLWALFNFVAEKSMGGYWTFAKRYCGAVKGDYGWVDKDETNPDELRQRLAAVSYRKLRREVAEWLPKSDYAVQLCSIRPEDEKKYRRLERHLAKEIRSVLDDIDHATPAERDAVYQLAQFTAAAKTPSAVDRIVWHMQDRGVKVVCFAHHHETLHSAADEYDRRAEELVAAVAAEDELLPPAYCAGGWLNPFRRKALIEHWRAEKGPAVLFVNSQSSGVGIDLADAEVAVVLELEWVPADMAQALDRLQDIHKGKATTPRLYELLLVKNTIDEAMAAVLLRKFRSINNIVGGDSETASLSNALRSSDVVGGDKLTLPSTDKETVAAALRAMRDRWLKAAEQPEERDENAALASSIADSWDDDEKQDDEDELDEASL